jgi:hypothetical protein
MAAPGGRTRFRKTCLNPAAFSKKLYPVERPGPLCGAGPSARRNFAPQIAPELEPEFGIG